MQPCPHCSNPLVQNIQHGKLNWFCRRCWVHLPKNIHHTSNIHDFPAQALQGPLAS